MCFFQDNIFLIIFSVFFSEEKIDNIQKMKECGVDIHIISTVTGLSADSCVLWARSTECSANWHWWAYGWIWTGAPTVMPVSEAVRWTYRKSAITNASIVENACGSALQMPYLLKQEK